MKQPIFISSSFLDKDVVFNLANKLNEINLNSFVDFLAIETNQDWEEVFLDKIKTSKVFVNLISRNYINSKCAMIEWGAALALDKPIISIIIDDVSMPFNLQNRRLTTYSSKKIDSKELIDVIRSYT